MLADHIFAGKREKEKRKKLLASGRGSYRDYGTTAVYGNPSFDGKKDTHTQDTPAKLLFESSYTFVGEAVKVFCLANMKVQQQGRISRREGRRGVACV